ncbi:MAG: methylglyoxal synthase [Alteromonadaceae bacterium]|nr:MAG: methylglyoxal synthase [Alteromonadaceae bacterium]
MKMKSVQVPAQKSIALIAHDNYKQALCDWVIKHKDKLSAHRLCATGTTGYKIVQSSGLEVQKYVSGPLGGDQQIGAKIAEGEVDILIFFWDPFEPMPHDPDVKALLRIAAAWNIPVACTPASADFMVNSSLLAVAFDRNIPDYEGYLADRI